MIAAGLAQAIGLFVGTNIDEIVLLALLFGQAPGRAGAWRVAIGQFLGFAALLAASVLGALGAGLLPMHLVRLLGLVPLVMGLYLGWRVWRTHRVGDDEPRPGQDQHGQAEHGLGEHGLGGDRVAAKGGLSVLAVTSITVANGGDNVGVYVPAFAASGPSALWVYVPVFLVLTAVWCVAGWYVARHPLVARGIERWGDVVLPVVLVAIGAVVLLG